MRKNVEIDSWTLWSNRRNLGMELDMRLKVSINRTWPAQKLGLPPDEDRWAAYNGSFTAEDHILPSLLTEIKQGHAFCCTLGECLGPCCGTWCAVIRG